MNVLTTPAYAGGIGTVFGALLTVSVQALLGVRQRRHDRINNLFDTKIELYSVLVDAVDEIRRKWLKINEIVDRSTLITASYRAMIDDLEALTEEFRKFQDKHASSDGTFPPTLSPEIRAEGRKLSGRYKEGLQRWEDVKNELATLDIAEPQSVIQGHTDKLLSISPKLTLIAEARLTNEVELLLQMIVTGLPVQSVDMNRVRNAARAEIGAGVRSWPRRKIDDARVWIQVKKFRFKNRKTGTPTERLEAATKLFDR